MPTTPTPKSGRPARAGLPDGLPVPGRFTHLHPDDGACLMEAASLLATGCFTDRPTGTHPVLAALARAVNDAVDDATRHTLWPLAADLANAHPADRAYGPLLVGTVVDAARRVRPDSRRLKCRSAACHARAHRLARARTRTTPARIADMLWWHGPGHHHLEHALRVLLTAPDADQRLSRLLHRAVTEARVRTTRQQAPTHAETTSQRG
ncbi:hypothetical protein HW130_25170 [Streptomyces sp. PKU-EA00015]|uniref:hypothetical protein n=1 Tax=Streptomyces sp. PKU-EA00015 TaxID=2748326 RepID=UPI0015A4A405|nr:hypothetical protein [Streptomyces sp. PKU-EA00015]NWF29505.1 hypothetical protein [Streptomyces sp. PKU-EA00015]